MPFSFHFDEGTKMFHVRAVGAVNDLQLMELNNRLYREPAFIACCPIMCDFTAVTEVLISSSVIESLAKAARSRTNFVAVIAPGAVAFGLARMYQIISDPEDARINVFAEAKEALVWLGTKCAARESTVGRNPREPEDAGNEIGVQKTTTVKWREQLGP
jgi:hypothetical protein